MHVRISSSSSRRDHQAGTLQNTREGFSASRSSGMPRRVHSSSAPRNVRARTPTSRASSDCSHVGARWNAAKIATAVSTPLRRPMVQWYARRSRVDKVELGRRFGAAEVDRRARRSARSSTCFNGAVAFFRDGNSASCSSPPPSTSGSFNWAVALQRRKCHQASAQTSNLAGSLQLGRRSLQRRKFDPSSFSTVRLTPASIGPSLFSDGNHALGKAFGRVGSSIGFNWAVALQRRKFQGSARRDAREVPFASIGPSLSSATEISDLRDEHPEAVDPRFNWAVALQRRKFPAPAERVAERDPASIGPSLFSDGNMCVWSASACAISSLQLGRRSSATEMRPSSAAHISGSP